jgi:hypothetical protein
MKRSIMFVLSAAVLASSGAFAQGATRDGSPAVPAASGYSTVTVAQRQAEGSWHGGGAASGDNSASSSIGTASSAMAGAQNKEGCMGPRTFCDIYYGGS